MNTGDSKSWTSLSIWMSILTVISSSALDVRFGQQGLWLRSLERLDSQYLEQVISLFIGLGKQAK